MPVFIGAIGIIGLIFLWQRQGCPPCACPGNVATAAAARPGGTSAAAAPAGGGLGGGFGAAAAAATATYQGGQQIAAPAVAPKPTAPATKSCNTCMGLYGTYVDSACPCNDPHCAEHGDCGPCPDTAPNLYGSFECPL